MRCPDGHDVPDGALFCPSCGAPLGVRPGQPLEAQDAGPVPIAGTLPGPRKRRGQVVAIAAGLVALLGTVGVVAALAGDRSDTVTSAEASKTPTASAPSTDWQAVEATYTRSVAASELPTDCGPMEAALFDTGERECSEPSEAMGSPGVAALVQAVCRESVWAQEPVRAVDVWSGIGKPTYSAIFIDPAMSPEIKEGATFSSSQAWWDDHVEGANVILNFADLPGREYLTIDCWDGGGEHEFTRQEVADAESVEPPPVAPEENPTASTLPPDRVAQGFMGAMLAGDETAAAAYGTREAMDAFYELVQEPAYTLGECWLLPADQAVDAGGEMYCPFDGEFSLLDFAVNEGPDGWLVAAVFGGSLE